MIRYIGVGFRRAQSNLRIAVYDGSNALKMRFEYAAGRMPVAMTKGGQRYYLAYDQVGSLRVVTDASGNAVKRIEYEAFGNIVNADQQEYNADFKVPFGFAGGLYDEDTGLVRFGYRDYDPDTGRWTAKDPIGFAGGDTDLYGYCLSDPVNFYDPDGLIVAQLIGGGIGAVFGGVVAYDSSCGDWGGVARSAAVGFGAGVLSTLGIPGAQALLGQEMATLFSGLLMGSASGFLGNIGAQVFVEGESLDDIDYESAMVSGLAGGVGGIIGAGAATIHSGQWLPYFTEFGSEVMASMVGGFAAGTLDTILQGL